MDHGYDQTLMNRILKNNNVRYHNDSFTDLVFKPYNLLITQYMHFKSDGFLYSNDFYAENGKIKHYIPMFSFIIRRDSNYIENI